MANEVATTPIMHQTYPCPHVRCQRVPFGSPRTIAPSTIARILKRKWKIPVGVTADTLSFWMLNAR